MGYFITLVVGILAGGFGGYKWGAAVERKMYQELAQAQQYAKKVKL